MLSGERHDELALASKVLRPGPIASELQGRETPSKPQSPPSHLQDLRIKDASAVPKPHRDFEAVRNLASLCVLQSAT